MGRFPTFQSPLLDRIEKKLRPGPKHAHAFMGHDDRLLGRILEEDDRTVRVLGLTHEAVADRLEFFTQAARNGWGDPVEVEGIFLVEEREARGRIPCPWPHPGLYRKNTVRLVKETTGEELLWSDLAVHMIRAHGFYQGEGSPYRLDPARLKRILDL